MKTVEIYHAQKGEAFQLSATNELPELKSTNWEVESKEMFEQQAQLIHDTLIKGLPGGTSCALLRLMLEHRASLLRVPL